MKSKQSFSELSEIRRQKDGLKLLACPGFFHGFCKIRKIADKGMGLSHHVILPHRHKIEVLSSEDDTDVAKICRQSVV